MLYYIQALTIVDKKLFLITAETRKLNRLVEGEE